MPKGKLSDRFAASIKQEIPMIMVIIMILILISNST